MDEIIIPVYIEKNYDQTLWAQSWFNGMCSEAEICHCKISKISDLSEISSNIPVILLGTSSKWLYENIAACYKSNRRVVVPGNVPTGVQCNMSSPDYDRAVREFVDTALARGYRSIAFFAPHLSYPSDCAKLKAFEHYYPYGRSFENKYGLKQTANELLERLPRKSAILCANEIAANILTKSLHSSEDTILFTFSSLIYEFSSDVNIILNNFDHGGQQAIKIWNDILENPFIRHEDYFHLSFIEKKAYIKPDSMERKNQASKHLARELGLFDDPYKDPIYLNTIRSMLLLNRLDRLDIAILCELIEGKHYEQVAEKLFIHPNTIKYRLKRIMVENGLKSKKELFDLVMQESDYLMNSKNGN